MILRAKTIDLFKSDNLNECQKINSELNINEIKENKTILKSYPRRLVFELTNACNLNCVMCGRNDAYFKPTVFDINWIDKFLGIMDKIEEITLMGWGEPTMHPNFKEILEKINKYNVRKYFCTNGMKLGELQESIFENKVDIIAVSLDGANKNTNDTIRRGSNFDKIVKSLKDIVKERNKRNIKYPYINFVFTAMKSNYKEIPDMVKLAHDIGIEEVKVVYLTAFSNRMVEETLYDCESEISKVFDEAVELAEKLGVKIKLPHIQGKDEVGNEFHKECYVGWRDFFLGSDGDVRPCMSTPIKLFGIDEYDNFNDMWNCEKFIDFRETVNDDKKMCESCKVCYQSSYANWNNKSSFIQVGNEFSPEWEK